ncbi:MAG: Lsr2 family protein [Nakamurella sp.]
MAKQTITTLTSDLSGKDITEESGGGSVTLAYDGKTVEVDLTGAEIEKLEKVLAPYLDKGRRTAATSRPQLKSSKRNKKDLADMRTWGRANGWPSLGDRGRIPADVEAAYESAH